MENYVNVGFDLVKALKNNFTDLNIWFEEVALLSLIISLSNNDKHCCYASNLMFADAFQTSERNIRKKLSKLESAGLIKRYSESEKGSFITKNRYIYPQFTIINDILSEFQKGGTNVPQYKDSGTIVPQYEEGGTIIPKRRNNRSTIAEQMDHDSGTIVPTNNKDIKDNKDIRRNNRSALTDSGTKVPPNNIEVSTDTCDGVSDTTTEENKAYRILEDGTLVEVKEMPSIKISSYYMEDNCSADYDIDDDDDLPF